MNNLKENNPYINDAFLNDIDLNEDIKKLYEKFNKIDDFNETEKLDKLKNQNYSLYQSINMNKLEGLPSNLNDDVEEIKKIYSEIEEKNLLIENLEAAKITESKLNKIEAKLENLNKTIGLVLQELIEINNKNLSKLSLSYFVNLKLDEKLKKELIRKYNDLILYKSDYTLDNFEDLKTQIKRNEIINEIFDALNLLENPKEKIIEYNQKILELKNYWLEKVNDLKNSNHDGFCIDEIFSLENTINQKFSYNDKNYDETKKLYKSMRAFDFEERINLIKERIKQAKKDLIKKQELENKKIVLNNLQKSIDNILTYYTDILDDNDLALINLMIQRKDSLLYELDYAKKRINIIINKIWSKVVTDVYSYNPDNKYLFICSDNQFIDEKYQTFILSTERIQRDDLYGTSQIGFVCNCIGNILYITNETDIMREINTNEILLTPQQLLESEFSYKIALDGYTTVLTGVYFIDDGDFNKKMMATDLANINNLPLIVIKKDN